MRRPIKLGLEKLLEDHLSLIKGARVGLICNQASVDHRFHHAADLLHGTLIYICRLCLGRTRHKVMFRQQSRPSTIYRETGGRFIRSTAHHGTYGGDAEGVMSWFLICRTSAVASTHLPTRWRIR